MLAPDIQVNLSTQERCLGTCTFSDMPQQGPSLQVLQVPKAQHSENRILVALPVVVLRRGEKDDRAPIGEVKCGAEAPVGRELRGLRGRARARMGCVSSARLLCAGRQARAQTTARGCAAARERRASTRGRRVPLVMGAGPARPRGICAQASPSVATMHRLVLHASATSTSEGCGGRSAAHEREDARARECCLRLAPKNEGVRPSVLTHHPPVHPSPHCPPSPPPPRPSRA